MNLNLIYSTLVKLFDHYALDDISSAITSVQTNIKALSSQPQNVTHQKNYADSIDELSEGLKPKNKIGLTDFDIETLQHAGLTHILPGHVLNASKQAQEISDLTPTVIAEKFEEIEEQFDSTHKTAKELKTTLEKLGAKDIFEPNEAYVAFIMSSQEYSGSYKEYVKDQDTFEKALRLIIDGADLEDKTLKLHALSNTDPVAILAASPPIIFLLCKVIQEILRTMKEQQEYQLIKAKVQTEKTRNKKLETELERHIEAKQNEAVSEIAKELVKSERNKEAVQEKLRYLENGIKFLMKMIAKGHSVDIIAGEYDEFEADEDDEETLTLTKQQYLEIIGMSHEVRKLNGTEVPQYLLEAPEVPDLVEGDDSGNEDDDENE